MRVLDPLTDSLWDEKLLAHEDASIFHTAAWARVLRDSYGYSCCHLAAMEGDRFSFLLPLMDVRSMLTGRRGISLPFTDFCEPLLAAGVSGEAVVRELIELGRRQRWKYFELRGGERILREVPPSMSVLGHSLDLGHSEETLFAGLKESTRRNVRKAQREGIKVSIGTSNAMVDRFCRLNCLTRREHGLPPQPLSFFYNIGQHLLDRELGCVVLGSLRGEDIGGAVYLHFGKDALYKYGASDRRYLAFRPNDLVMWEAIRWYHDRGFRRLDFGRTELQHDGLRRYKLAWGVEERVRPYYRHDLASGRFVGATMGGPWRSAGVFRLLPTSLARAIGTALYRHVA